MAADYNISDEATLNEFARALQDLGYRAKVDTENGLVATAAGGMLSTLTPTPEMGVQLRCLVTGFTEAPALARVNQVNGTYRFVKFYVDDDNDLTMEADFLCQGKECWDEEWLGRVMALWEGFTSILKGMLEIEGPSKPGA